MWKYFALSVLIFTGFLVHIGLGLGLMSALVIFNIIILRCSENKRPTLEETLLPFWPIGVGIIFLLVHVVTI